MVGQFFCSSEGQDSFLAFPVVQEKMTEGWRGNAHIPAYIRVRVSCYLEKKRRKRAGCLEAQHCMDFKSVYIYICVYVCVSVCSKYKYQAVFACLR